MNMNDIHPFFFFFVRQLQLVQIENVRVLHSLDIGYNLWLRVLNTCGVLEYLELL